jgi:hypothetical protein
MNQESFMNCLICKKVCECEACMKKYQKAFYNNTGNRMVAIRSVPFNQDKLIKQPFI